METVETSTGVVFKIKNLPAMALRDKHRQLERQKPMPPVVYIEDKGRDEENPNDPDYRAALARFTEDEAVQLYEVAIVLGLEVESVSNGVPKCEDNSWLLDMDLLSMDVPSEGKGRFLAWVKYIAAPRPEDMAAIEKAVMNSFGVAEEDVAEAVASFPNRAERRSNRKRPSK